MNLMTSVAVMGHEKRAKYFDDLRNVLGPVPFFVDKDGKENIGLWKNSKRAWLSFDPAATFHMVVQDDAILGFNFFERLLSLLNEYGTGNAYCLYYRHKRSSTHGAMVKAASEGYKKGHFLFPRLQFAVAVVLPTKIIPEAIAYADKQNHYGQIDDLRISAYLDKIGMLTLYPLPSLVDHRSEGTSLVGNGINKGRQATWFEETLSSYELIDRSLNEAARSLKV